MISVKHIGKNTMGIRNLNIGVRLALGFAIIVAFSILIGIIALQNISTATKATENMYMHPLTVSNAVRDIKTNIIAIHRSMKDVALANNEQELFIAEQEVDRLEDVVNKKFDVVYSQFLGNMDDVKKAHESFLDWKPIREEVIYLWQQGKKDEAIAITKGKGAKHVNKVLTDVDVMVDFANAKADSFYALTKADEKRSFRFMILLLSVIFIFSSVIIFVFTRSLVSPIRKLNVIAGKIGSGDLSVRHDVKAKDEISQLAISFNKMADSIELRNSVLEGLSGISGAMLGKIKLIDFAESLLLKLADLTDSQMATFYIREEGADNFIPLASIGTNATQLKSFHIANSPGDLGNVIRSQKLYHLRNISNDTIFLYNSVAGELIPKEVITIPVVQDQKVIALISCVSILAFTNESLTIIEQAQPIINASFNTLLANRKTRKFSEQLVLVNQELEAQSEELQEQTEELKQQSDELKISSDSLLEQNVELEMQRRQVEEANRLKSEFLSNMSHELRTPLNSINALSNVLRMQLAGKLDDDETNYLKIIERNGKRLLSLINDILDLSKVEAGKMEMDIRTFSLNSALTYTVESLQALAADKGIELKLDISGEIQIDSDENRLNQVITNVLGNAIKFTEKGSVNVLCEQRNENVCIVIKDTGIGIDADVLPLIFQEFRQADGTTSRAYEGTGLGLAIASKIIEALNGTIKVESVKGVGSTFSIEIPSEVSQSKVLEAVTQIAENPAMGNSKAILVVDDDKKLVAEISKKLENEGYTTIKAHSGTEALELAVLHKPYAITLDILMPEIDGWEVLQKLQRNSATRDIPVIIISKSDDLETSLALGAVGYIQKPVDKNLLIQKIRKINTNARKIAIVDDSEIDRMQIRRTLVNENLDHIMFENGRDCLNYLKTELPDVLVLDLMMPEMDGFQVLKEIRNTHSTSRLPVIVVTAKDLSQTEKDFLRGRATAILAKGDTTKAEVVNEIYRIVSQMESETQNETEKPNKKTGTILIIEDNESAVIQIRKVLQKAGLNVHHASGGKEALEFVKHTVPDGIILDLMMPEMDGFEVLENIRSAESTREIPVIILTAKNLTKADLDKLSANNIQQLIQKGDINVIELLSKVNQMLGVGNPSIKKAETASLKTSDERIIEERKKAKILIVEDNPDNRITVRAIIGNKYETIEAEDGELGIQKSLTELPDLILLDISLPKKDGFDVIAALKENQKTKNIPVIALTAKAMKGDREKITEAGCDEYISKPIDAVELLQKINLLLLK